jgi:hypothetical protein
MDVNSFTTLGPDYNGTECFKNVKKIFEQHNIYSFLEASGGQSSNLYLNVAHFFTPELIRHLWQLKTVVFLHWCLMCALLYVFVQGCIITIRLPYCNLGTLIYKMTQIIVRPFVNTNPDSSYAYFL